MPRYFFHFQDVEGLTTDDEGVELPHLTAVETEALAALSQMARDGIRDGIDQVAVEVADSKGIPILKAVLRLEVTRFAKA